MKTLEQLNRWVKGESIHNDERDECCPDFSCCVPDLLADKETRTSFRDAYLSDRDSVIHEYLSAFLGKAIAYHGEKKIHIAGRGLEN